MPFLAEDALPAANLEPHTRPLGLSLGDRACLVLGLARNDQVFTADRVWAKLASPALTDLSAAQLVKLYSRRIGQEALRRRWLTDSVTAFIGSLHNPSRCVDQLALPA